MRPYLGALSHPMGQPPRGGWWTATMIALTNVLSGTALHSLCKRYPKRSGSRVGECFLLCFGAETTNLVLLSMHRTSIPVKPGRSQTRHSRKGETAARHLVSLPQSYTAHSIPLTRIDREVTAGLELKLTSVQNAFPDSFVSSTQRFAESLRGTKMMFRG